MNLLMLTMMIVANPQPTESPSQTTLKFDFASDWSTGSAFGVHRGTPSEIHDCLHSLGERNGAPGSLDDVAGWQIEVVTDAPQDGLMARITLSELFPMLKSGYHGGGEIILNVAAMTGKRSIRLGLDRPASAPSEVMVDLSTDSSARASSHIVMKVPRLESRDAPYEYLTIAFAGSGAARLTLRDIRLRDVPLSDVTDATRLTKATEESKLALRKGLWAWHYDRFLASAQSRQELADFCKREGITDLFLKTPYTYEDESVTLTHVAELQELIAALAAGDIRTHALDGQADFVLQENHDRVLRFVDAIAQYNAASQPADRFVGVHLDNEPYLLKAWRDKETRDAVHQSYFDINAAVARSCKTHKLEFGLDVPFWFDSADDDGRYLYWIDRDAGRSPLIEAIIELADNVAIMSYRERILGAGCVIDCCAKEFELGDRYDTDVFASVELGMGKNVEVGTSLGRFDREYVHRQLATLWSVAHRQRGCAGMAIHYYDAFRKLESVQ